ncbi:DUF397 domain-containing protein [Streptomyces sp. NPDC058308]|uniref:DUF397 domain-containing protein n=1 Tax=Streptomyces sp. NPDC058308 TaxID=3346440 RepID=UPI0036E495A8
MNPSWQKSSYCSEGSSCIHVAVTATNTIRLTESADPTGAIVRTTPTAFAALIRNAKQPAGAELT